MTRIFALALALIVALTSQQLALARGQGIATGEMVICTGGGFATVAVDARGRPVGPAHVCPDGLQGFSAAGDVATAPTEWLAVVAPAFRPALHAVVPRAAVPLNLSARAPPQTV